MRPASESTDFPGFCIGSPEVNSVNVIKAGSIEELLQLMAAFSMFVGVVMVIVIGWSMSQYWRFHGKDRRAETPSPDPGAEMALWNIDEALFTGIRSAK
jgi:hypothetical protein